MTTAAELIHALQRRLRLTHYRTRPGEFPPGWQAWFDRMRERSGAVTGATAEAIVAVLLQRPLAAPPASPADLNRWQAFSTIWRQQWQPPAREERWLRAFAAIVSGLVHLLFVVVFLWLGIMQFAVTGAPPRGEETVIKVEYLGTGAPEQVGGGPIPEREAEVPEPVATVPQPEPSPEPPQRSGAAGRPVPELPPLPEVPSPRLPQLRPEQPRIAPREIPEPQPTEQPLVLSKPVPDRGSFVLPPPTLQVPDAETAMPALQLPELERSAEAPEPLPEFRPALPQVEIEAPAIRRGVPELAVREIPVPLPRIELPQPGPPSVETPELRPRVPRVRELAIPAPPAPDPAEADEQVDERPAVAEAPAPAGPVVPVAAQPAPTALEPLVGAGPEPVPAPGGWPAPEVDDSWDLAGRDRPGAQAGQPPGLYDSDGSVNLAETPGSDSPGLPPGTVTQEIAHLDRAGTWLRRPPTDNYDPTVFEQYWRPNETLIAEWVRKSITTIRIPIPGTSKSIVCKTILIAVGGACDIFDPNLNDQPATARPPPDIPFKPELQEGNGSAPPAG